MRYATKEQAFLEPCKDGSLPEEVYEVEHDSGKFFTTQYWDAIEFLHDGYDPNVGSYKTIRFHKRGA